MWYFGARGVQGLAFGVSRVGFRIEGPVRGYGLGFGVLNFVLRGSWLVLARVPDYHYATTYPDSLV